jgi:hypothetical protein
MQSIQCPSCQWLTPTSKGNQGLKCLAFPEGIPKEIQSGEIDHSKPVEGDGGIVYHEDVMKDLIGSNWREFADQ